MTSAESDALTKEDDLFWTRTSKHVRWYVVNRIIPAIIIGLVGIVVWAAIPPWGELSESDFTAIGMTLYGALLWEAIKYKPWRDTDD